MLRESAQINPTSIRAPLFPLPNVVLFPRAVLPLHIFEDRYKAMMRHALAGDHRIAMALLKPGWEKNYHQTPAIEPIVCIGRILSSERLPDGKYNLLLQGEYRAEILSESITEDRYRLAEMQTLAAPDVMEIDLVHLRQRLAAMLGGSQLAESSCGCTIQRILSSTLGTSDAADLIAYTVLENVNLKQSLLAERDPIRRVNRLIGALEMSLPMLEAASGFGSNSVN
jgi:Lon protease-like protein